MSISDSTRESFPLIIQRPNEDVSIEICDAFDRLVAAPLALQSKSNAGMHDTSFGRQLTIMLPRGLYTVRGTLGGEVQEQIVRVNGAQTIDAPQPARSTAAAYQGVESSHEYYSNPAADHSRQPTLDAIGEGQSADSSIFLFLRARDKESYAASGGGLENAASQLHLETPQGQVISLVAHSQIHSHGWLAFSAPAPAGDFLLHDLGEEPRTTPIVLYSGWQIQLFLTFDRRPLHATLRVFLSPLDRGFQLNDDWARATDLGLSVLVSGQGAVPAEARRIMLGDKFENPMLGLIAAWLALRDFTSQRKLSQDVLSTLDHLLPASPDVAVLRIAFARRYGGTVPVQPIHRTPMMQTAVSELIRAAAEHPDILPDDSLLNDVSPRLYADSAFTSWRPLDSELPASLRAALNTDPLSFNFDSSRLKSRFELLNLEVERALTGIQLGTPGVGYDTADEVPGTWLQESVAELIEQQARRKLANATASILDTSAMAKRAGVTPKAVQKVLQTAPLEGLQVAMSLSNTADGERPEGCTANHVIDATVYLARTLISEGASIAYGGDFRKNGYTPLLAEMIQTYNQTTTRAPQFLHMYLGAPIPPDSAPENLPLVIHHMVHSPDVTQDAIMPPPSAAESHPKALYYSDMRRVMARHTSARIILGGSSTPRQQENGRGYGGRYAGIVEEAWRTLEAQKPLYVAGGFGGAAALVADLLEGRETPQRLQDQTWLDSAYVREKANAIDADPYRTKLGLPQRMDDLAQAVRDLGLPLLANDLVSVQWNGLTVKENRFLFRTRDPEMLTTLVLKGLLAIADRHR